MSRMSVQQLERSYERFHGRGVRYARSVRFDPPKGFVVLGEAVAVEYRCDKYNGGGDGRKAVYRHSFKRGAILAADQDMKGRLYILGSGIKVKEAGITG